MKKLSTFKDPAIEKQIREITDNLRITDVLPQGEEDYWWDAAPLATDKEKPYIRPVKIGSTRYLYFFDVASEIWSYLAMTNA